MVVNVACHCFVVLQRHVSSVKVITLEGCLLFSEQRVRCQNCPLHVAYLKERNSYYFSFDPFLPMPFLAFLGIYFTCMPSVTKLLWSASLCRFLLYSCLSTFGSFPFLFTITACYDLVVTFSQTYYVRAKDCFLFNDGMSKWTNIDNAVHLHLEKYCFIMVYLIFVSTQYVAYF